MLKKFFTKAEFLRKMNLASKLIIKNFKKE